MIWRRISIESVLKSILSLQMNLCLFSRSNLDSDQNTVVNRKWLELTALSADGIYLFSRFIVDRRLVKSTYLFSRSVVDDDRNTRRSEVTWISCSLSKWISPFSRSINDNDPNTLVERWWVEFTSVAPNSFFRFLDLAWRIMWTSLPIESEKNSLLFPQLNFFVFFMPRRK